MEIKKAVHHIVFLLVMAVACILTIFVGVTVVEAKTWSQNSPTTVEKEEESDISEQIIMSATNYLLLTSYYEDVDTPPELESALEPIERMVIDVSEEEIYLMACQVYVEAGGESYEGMVGVANVIINRVLSDAFPNTVTAVIYQKGQFPPAYNGSLDKVLENGPSDAAMEATIDALYGANTVGDYLYFNMASGVRISKCSSYLRIGGNIFYMP